MNLIFRICPEYSEIGQYVDRDFNYPRLSECFSEEDFEKEYDQVFNRLVTTLRLHHPVDDIGGVGDPCPISMSRWVGLNRSITIVVEPPAIDPAVPQSMFDLLQKLNQEYAFCIDASGAGFGQVYVVVRKSGEVLGYAEDDAGLEALEQFGFSLSKEDNS